MRGAGNHGPDTDLLTPRHNGAVPRIAAATVAENRELRRDALLAAAASLMMRTGTFTVAEVSREVGLSRSAVYEYYTSAADLVADVLVDELAAWSQELVDATSKSTDARGRSRAWLDAVLAYVVDGRHALLRACGAIDLPPARRSEVQALHQSLLAPLVDALASMGHTDPDRVAWFAWGATQAAIERIESAGADPAEESRALIAFLDRALATEAR